MNDTHLSAIYVYGLIRGDLRLDLGCIGIEEEGAPSPICTLREGSVAAVVSARQNRHSVMPRRCDLDAHRHVTSAVAAIGTIVPFAFGQVARGEDAVRGLLRTHESAISMELDRLDGKVQMGLKVQWHVDNIYQYLVESEPRLASLRDTVFASPDPDIAQQMLLGELFDETLEARRHDLVTRLIAELAGDASTSPKELPVRSEKEIADLMFLIDRGGRARFEDDVQRIADTWPDEYTLRTTGPWAPFNFVELEIPIEEGDETWAY